VSESSIPSIVIYSTHGCPDCFRVKRFLRDRGVAFREVDIEHDPDGENLVLRVNDGKRKVPTLEIGDRYIVCSPFHAQELADELGISLNSQAEFRND
jgi:glutaredoxin